MVEENFKIGVELELEQTSLANITKQVEKAIKKAFSQAAPGAAGPGRAPQRSAAAPAGGTSATARSLRDATKASSADFTKVVNQLARENKITASKFDDAAAGVVQALDKLTKALERRPATAAGPTAQQTAKLVARQVGPTNKNLARDIQKSRLEAGRQTTGSGGTSEKRTDLRTGTKKDNPRAMQSARDRQAARGGGGGKHPLQRHAEVQSKAVAASLDRLGKEISSLGKLSEIPELLKRIGLPTGGAVSTTRSASVEVKTLSGQTKTVTGYLKIVGNDLREFSNVVTKRVNDLMRAPDFQSNLKRAERTSRKGPQGEERAISMLRRELKSLLDLPSIKQGGAMAFEKGGEAVLDIEFSKDLQDRLKALKDESAQIALVNKELWEMSSALEELRKQGGQVIGSVGLGEERAAKAKIIKGEGGVPLKATMPVQLRDLAGMNLGGRGGMRAARSFQPMQAREMVGGGRPAIMGKGEAQAYETGAFSGKMTRTLKTAYADPSQLPEVHEDMILLDKKAAESMGMWEPKITQALKELAEGIQAGGSLVEGQVIGLDIEGKEIKFDMKGAKAEIDSIENVVENGIEGVRIKFKELYEMTTGSKMTTSAGFKGVARVEEDIVGKYGLPEGTQAAISSVGAAKRGVIADPMKMMASEIAKASGVDAQEVANKIEAAMREGGQDFATAVEAAAQGAGLSGFSGGAQGRNIKAMTGDLPWMRMKEPRAPGAGDIGTRYLDKPAMQALGSRAGTAKMAQDMMARMKGITEQQKEYIATLQAVAGESDVAAESLRQMLPEDFKRLPPGVGPKEEFEGTIMDPKFKEAMAIRMPARGGDEKLFRMPSLGKGLGQRGGFQTDLGAQGPDAMTRQLDQIMQSGRQIRMAEGRAAPDLGTLQGDSETFSDAAHQTSRALKDQIDAIYQLGIKTEEGASAAESFVNEFLPLIEALNVTLSDPIQFFKTKGGERTTGDPITVGRKGMGAGEFIKGRGNTQQQMLAVQDVLAGRTARKKGGTENVPTSGEIFKNAELLQKVMERLGVTMEQDADAVEVLYSRLEKLEEKFVGMLAMSGFATPG